MRLSRGWAEGAGLELVQPAASPPASLAWAQEAAGTPHRGETVTVTGAGTLQRIPFSPA